MRYRIVIDRMILEIVNCFKLSDELKKQAKILDTEQLNIN